MEIILISLIVAVVIILILIVVNLFSMRYSKEINQKMDKLLENGKVKDFRDILLSQKDRNNDLEERIKEAFLKIKNLEDISETTIRKIGVVRFNPFNDMGGNQSFIIALLNDKNDGFIISSLFVKDGNRVYAKTIKQGKSDHALSKEEIEAMSKAVNGK